MTKFGIIVDILFENIILLFECRHSEQKVVVYDVCQFRGEYTKTVCAKCGKDIKINRI